MLDYLVQPKLTWAVAGDHLAIYIPANIWVYGNTAVCTVNREYLGLGEEVSHLMRNRWSARTNTVLQYEWGRDRMRMRWRSGYGGICVKRVDECHGIQHSPPQGKNFDKIEIFKGKY